MTECPRERDVIAAVHDAWSARPRSAHPSADADAASLVLAEALRAHAAACPACAEAVTVAHALLMSAAIDEREPLMASRWLLVKARVRERHLAARRLERWHTWSVAIGAWAIVLMAGCLVVPSLVSENAAMLQTTAAAGLVTFLVTAAAVLWRWSHLES